SNFIVKATDSVGASVQLLFSITINSAVSITTPSLANWTVNKSGYSQTILATGGTGARTFSVLPGTLPTGLTLSSAGALTGTPTVSGSYSFTVTATDSVGGTGTRPYTVTINAALSITNGPLANWTVNKSGYSQTIVAIGGTGNHTFALTFGSLPTGLSLNSAG